MPKRNVILFDVPESPWKDFLQEYLEDTRSVLHFFDTPSHIAQAFDKIQPDVLFTPGSLLSLPLIQKIKTLRISRPEFLAIRIGEDRSSGKAQLDFDKTFITAPEMCEFEKEMAGVLSIPEKVRLLIIDDEPEIAGMIKDFFETRKTPLFEVQYAVNGKEGLECLQKSLPDLVILDVKMPVKDGREVYREIKKRGLKVPVIMFFDAIFGDEVAEINSIGKTAIVEKGSSQSSPPVLLVLVKKMIFFS